MNLSLFLNYKKKTWFDLELMICKNKQNKMKSNTKLIDSN